MAGGSAQNKTYGTGYTILMNPDPVLMNPGDFLTDHMAKHTRISKVEIYHPKKKEPLPNGDVIVKTCGQHETNTKSPHNIRISFFLQNKIIPGTRIQNITIKES